MIIKKLLTNPLKTLYLFLLSCSLNAQAMEFSHPAKITWSENKDLGNYTIAVFPKNLKPFYLKNFGFLSNSMKVVWLNNNIAELFMQNDGELPTVAFINFDNLTVSQLFDNVLAIDTKNQLVAYQDWDFDDKDDEDHFRMEFASCFCRVNFFLVFQYMLKGHKISQK